MGTTKKGWAQQWCYDFCFIKITLTAIWKETVGKYWNKETSQGKMQAWSRGHSNQDGSSGGRERRPDSEYTLKVETTEFGFGVWRETGIKDGSGAFGLSNYNIRKMFPSTEMGEDEGDQIWGWRRSGRHAYVKPEVSFKHLSRDIEAAIASLSGVKSLGESSGFKI